MVPSAPAAIAPTLAPFWPSIVKADLEKSPLRDMRAKLLPPGPKKLAGNQRAPSEPTTRPVGDPYWNWWVVRTPPVVIWSIRPCCVSVNQRKPAVATIASATVVVYLVLPLGSVKDAWKVPFVSRLAIFEPTVRTLWRLKI